MLPGNLVQLVKKAVLAFQAPLDFRDLLVLEVMLVNPENLVTRASLVDMVLRDNLDQKVM